MANKEQRELRPGDIDMIKYFWERHEDVKRYVEYDYIKDALKKKHPALLKTINKYNRSKDRVNLIIRNLEDEEYT